jgi:AcrR family transcriptional regulator
MPKNVIDYSSFKRDQLEAARLMSDPDERLTNAEIAERVGVSERTIYRWKEDADFIALLNDLADKHMDSFLAEAYRQLQTSARRGSVKALELILKRQGKLIERREVVGEITHTAALDGKTNDQLADEIAALEAQLLELKERESSVIDITPGDVQ